MCARPSVRHWRRQRSPPLEFRLRFTGGNWIAIGERVVLKEEEDWRGEDCELTPRESWDSGGDFSRAPVGLRHCDERGCTVSPSFSFLLFRARFVQTRIYETVCRIFVYITTAILVRPELYMLIRIRNIRPNLFLSYPVRRVCPRSFDDTYRREEAARRGEGRIELIRVRSIET